MFDSSVDKAVLNKSRNKFLVKAIIIFFAVFLLLFVSIKIGTLIMISKYFENIKKNTINNDKQRVEYNSRIDWLNSSVVLSNVAITLFPGTIDIDEVIVSKNSGFIFPSSLKLSIKGIDTTTQQGKQYFITNSNGEYTDFYVSLNRPFFKLPIYGGFYTDKKNVFKMSEENREIGKLILNKTTIKQMYDGKSNVDYSGEVVFHDGDFVPSLILVDKPFKWNLKFTEYKVKKLSNGSSSDEFTNYLNAEKIILDFDFASLKMNGNLSYDGQLRTSDFRVEIQNYKQFISSILNMVIQTNEDNIGTFKKMYAVISNDVVPLLKKNSKESNGNKLVLDVKKPTDESDTMINGVNVFDIALKLSKIK